MAKVERICHKCGKTFLIKLYMVNKGRGKFCSIPCSNSCINATKTGEKNPNWKGGIAADNYHYKKRQVERYPERVKARDAANRAIRTGKLVRQPCEFCGEKKTQAHHDDYIMPLKVRWMCRKCHREYHQRHTSDVTTPQGADINTPTTA